MKIFYKPVYFTAIIFILSCSSVTTNNEQLNSEAPIQVSPDSHSSPSVSIVDFKATGNEPFWSLEIDFDQKMHFKSLNHPEDLITPVPEPDFAQDHQVERYRAVTEGGELIVSISRETCTDIMSGDKFPFRVSVSVKLSTDDEYTDYNGCGRYLLDQRLHNIWALEEMEGEAVTTEDFNLEVPTLELFAAEGKIVGTDGCNRMFGKVTGNKSRLEFGVLGSTMMACIKMEKSTQFQKLISEQSYDYHFDAGQLLLSRNGKAVLKFRNVD